MIALLLATALAYSPGLSGGFLFDDFVNLDAIGATGPVDDWATFFRYLTSGNADPTGRPIALLSFLIDARDWPAEPGPFLRTNLLLHLANGLLLFQLLRMLGRALDGPTARTDAPALLGAGLWLLHPLFVSTTLYVVQREAMLPAAFMLGGLIAFVHGRGLADAGATRSGGAWMLGGILGGTVLALGCKGNGVLLPVLAGVIELLVLRRGAPTAGAQATRRLQLLLLGVPSLLLLLYLLSYLPILAAPVPDRGWSRGQRLLTESRVLCEYLWLLLLPRSVSSGLYNDAYVASTSLLQPLSTLLSVLALIGLAGLAWLRRRAWPAFSAAVMFFLCGHLLESSVVPLELYFEHRNYVPAMLLFWPLARALFASPLRPALRTAVAGLLLLLFAATTLQRSVLWGQPERLAALWALQNPGSSRAQATIAMMDTGAGRPELAVRRLLPQWQRHPRDLQLALNLINARCVQGALPDPEFTALLATLRSADSGLRLLSTWLGRAIDTAQAGNCRGLDLDNAGLLVDAVATNPHYGKAWPLDVAQLRGRLALARGQPAAALAAFDGALDTNPSPGIAARQAAMLATRGYYPEARAHLDRYEAQRDRVAKPGFGMPSVHAWVLERQGYWDYEMRVLRAKLDAEIAAGTRP